MPAETKYFKASTNSSERARVKDVSCWPSLRCSHAHSRQQATQERREWVSFGNLFISCSWRIQSLFSYYMENRREPDSEGVVSYGWWLGRLESGISKEAF